MLRVVIATAAALLAFAATAHAGAGGVSPDQSPSDPETGGGTGPAGGGTPAPGPWETVLDPLRGAYYRYPVSLTGRVARGGWTVVVERDAGPLGWIPVARTTARRDGSFTARWRASRLGRQRLRARPALTTARTARHLIGVASFTRLTVYRPALATWYGPGFFGRWTACRVLLTPSTHGVAHRVLPCGTPVELYYRGRTIRTRVIDRGPYANGADWDLTYATARALGFAYTAPIGAIFALRR